MTRLLPIRSSNLVWILLLTVGFNCVSNADGLQRPKITPDGEDVTFSENVEPNELRCDGENEVAWFFARDKELELKQQSEQLDDGTFVRSLTLNTIDETDLQRFVGFYYCYYESKITTNELSAVILEQMIKDETASKIYVYIQNSEQFLLNVSTNIQATLGSTVTIPCLPTFNDVNLKISLADNNNQIIKVPHVATVGFVVSQFNESHLHDIYKCRAVRAEHIDQKETNTFVLTWNENYDTDDDLTEPEGKQRQPDPPTIVSDTKEYVGAGQTLRLDCWSSNARHKVTWILPPHSTAEVDGRLQIETTKTNNGINTTLLITNANIDTDKGDYKCDVQTTNTGTEQYSADSKFHIRIIDNDGCDIIIKEPLNMMEIVSEPHGGEKVWYVLYSGYPSPLIAQWKTPKGAFISDSDEFDIVNHMGSIELRIKNPQLQHAGLYELVVSNDRCEKSEKFKLIVNDPPLLFCPEIQRSKTDEEVKVECTIVGYPLSELACTYTECPIVPFFVYPQTDQCKETQPLEKNSIWFETVSHGTSSQNVTITFTPTSPGILSCDAKNYLNNSPASTIVRIQDHITDFHIDSLAEVAESDTTSITCFASVYVFNNYASLQRSDGTVIKSTDDITVDESIQGGMLKTTVTFNEISKSYQGDYSCNAITFENENQSKSVSIAVLDKLGSNFDGKSTVKEQVVVKQSGALSLDCQPSGTPTPSVQWFHNDQLLESDDPRVFINSTYLYVDRPRREDDGVYKCRAENRDAVAEKIFTVKIDFGGLGLWAVLIMVILLVLLTILCIVLIIVYRRERTKRLQLKHAGISYFVEGNEESMDPEKTIMEQADMLRYDTSYDFPMKDLKLGKRLGQGAFGEVLMAEATGLIAGEPRTMVAVKRAKAPLKDEDMKALITELKIMIYIGKHVNVVNILGVVRENIKNRQLLVMTEYCEFGNLFDFLSKNRKYFVNQVDRSDKIDPSIMTIQEQLVEAPKHSSRSYQDYGHDSTAPLLSNGTRYSQQTVLNTDQSNGTGSYIDHVVQTITTTDLVSWSFQVAQGMHYLSTRGVLHGDLAARNVLLCRDRVIKICDFGLSRWMRPEEDYKKESNGLLPIKWLALESITHKTFNTSTDVWSFGVFMWELFSLISVPYPDIPTDDLLRRLEMGYRMPQPKYATQDIYDIMLSCWRLSPSKRPTFTQLGDMMSNHMTAELRQEVIDKNSLYMEATNDNYLQSVVSTINAPTDEAPRIPSTLINVDDDYDHMQAEAFPMLSLAHADSDTDLDQFGSAPKQSPPPPPVTVPPRTSAPHNNTYENLPPRLPAAAAREKDAVSNLGYIQVYDKERSIPR